jgi:hypothetical protein
MTHTTREVPARARELAARLAILFEEDQQLAVRLNDAQQQLQQANDRLWSGLHPEGLAAVYGDHPEFEAVQLEAALDSRSELLDSADPLGAIQQVHWTIHRAFVDYQTAGEDRRQLAADIGELTRAFVDVLTASGWSEDQARNADVHELAATP